MNIFLLLTIAMLMIILMLRRHIPIGPCMLTSGIFIWLMKAPELPYLVQALRETLTMPRTYDILLPFILSCAWKSSCAPAVHWQVWCRRCSASFQR